LRVLRVLREYIQPIFFYFLRKEEIHLCRQFAKHMREWGKYQQIGKWENEDVKRNFACEKIE